MTRLNACSFLAYFLFLVFLQMIKYTKILFSLYTKHPCHMVDFVVFLRFSVTTDHHGNAPRVLSLLMCVSNCFVVCTTELNRDNEMHMKHRFLFIFCFFLEYNIIKCTVHIKHPDHGNMVKLLYCKRHAFNPLECEFGQIPILYYCSSRWNIFEI